MYDVRTDRPARGKREERPDPRDSRRNTAREASCILKNTWPRDARVTEGIRARPRYFVYDIEYE